MRNFLKRVYIEVVGYFVKPHPGIHIINSHYITPGVHEFTNDYFIFEEYLQYLQSFGRFINLEEAVAKIESKHLSEKEVQIAFTFDDGYEECYTVIAPLLEKYGCRGAFFINANYIDSPEDYQKGFNDRVSVTTKNPMTWKQVMDLHNRGHLIGSHNLDHTNFAILSNNDIEAQLKNNSDCLQQKLEYSCEYFAWTYGTFNHFPNEALKITSRFHKYILSGTDFKNYFSYGGRVINRRHIESYWPKSQIKYFLSFPKKYGFN